MRAALRGVVGVLLAAAPAGCGSDGSSGTPDEWRGKPLETLGVAAAADRLTDLATELQTAARLPGGSQGFRSFSPSNCDDGDGNAIHGLYQMSLVWNWDGVEVGELNVAVLRVRDFLAMKPGWDVSRFRFTNGGDAELVAYGPDETSWVDVFALPAYGRVSFKVSLPCTKVPSGDTDPIFETPVK